MQLQKYVRPPGGVETVSIPYLALKLQPPSNDHLSVPAVDTNDMPDRNTHLKNFAHE